MLWRCCRYVTVKLRKVRGRMDDGDGLGSGERATASQIAGVVAAHCNYIGVNMVTSDMPDSETGFATTRGSRTRRRILLAVGLVAVLLAAAVVFAITRPWAAGSDSSHVPWVTLPPNTPNAQVDVTADVDQPAGRNDLVDFARPLTQNPAEIDVSIPVTGATVTFPVDPAADLTGTDGRQLDPGNLFIAVYNDDLELWIPLDTTYDPVQHTISATAPHFSKYWSWITDPAVAAGKAAAKTVQAVGQAEWNGLQIIGDSAGKVVTGVTAYALSISDAFVRSLHSQEEVPSGCGESKLASVDVVFAQTSGALSGCVEKSTAGNYQLRTNNESLVPFTIGLRKAGVDPDVPGYSDDLATTLVSYGDWWAGLEFVGGSSSVATTIPEKMTKQKWQAAVRPDIAAMLGSAFFAGLSILPLEGKYEEAMKSIRPQIEEFVTTHPTASIGELFHEVVRLLTQAGQDSGSSTSDAAKVGHFAQAVSDGYECILADAKLLDAAATGNVDQLLKKALNYGLKCASTVLALFDGTMNFVGNEVIGFLSAIPGLLEKLEQDVQFSAMGPEVMNASLTVDGTSADVPTTPATPTPESCDQTAVAPEADSTETEAIHLDLDANYQRPYERSDPVSECGKDSMVITYADPSSPKSQRIDVRTYDSATKKWALVQTFDPHGTQQPSGQPYVPFDTSGSSCHGECIQQAHITDGDVDFLVQGENSTLDNGLTVVSVKDGHWRMVPFLNKPDLSVTPAPGSTPYVPAASLVGDEIHVDLNNCQPSCANGQHSTMVFTYNTDQQGFQGTVTPSGSVAPSPSATQTLTVPVFVTPSSNIMCGAAAGNQVLCFIHNHDFATDACDIGQPGFTLYLNPNGPAVVSGCANDASIGFASQAVPNAA